MDTSIAVILLNWIGGDNILACLASLIAGRSSRLHIIVVDNGSSDDSLQRIASAYPDVTLIRNGANMGFAEGNNIGIRHALEHGAEFILLLNDDTEVAPNFLDVLLAAAHANPTAGFLGPRIYYHGDPTRIWMGNPVWDARRCRFDYLDMEATAETAAVRAPSPGSYVCGCALLVRRRVLEEVGLMDPRFFCYFEEVDWCFRGARAGWGSLYVPASHIWHKVSAASGGRLAPTLTYYRTRNSLLWAERALSICQRVHVLRNHASDVFRSLHLGWSATSLAGRLRRAYWNAWRLHRDPGLTAWRHGLWDYLRRRFGEAPEAIQELPRESFPDTT